MKAFSSSSSSSTMQAKGLVRVAPARRLAVFARESRVGSKPVPIPKGVTITIDGASLKVKGPKGELAQQFVPVVKLEKVGETLKVTKLEDTRLGNSQHGLTRTLASNMIVGVSTGFEKRMELVGTGYRASVQGKELQLNVGYNKPRLMPIPEGLAVKVEKNTQLIVSGADKVKIGDFCATIRRQREPEPYKGKGIRYEGEVIKLKEGKGAGGKKK